MLKDIENELGSDFLSSHDKSSLSDSENKQHDQSSGKEDPLNPKRTSYYVEENERILNLLITNCEPILSEMVANIDHFNTYNHIQRVVERSGLIIEEYSVASDCKLQGPLFNHQQLYMSAQSNANGLSGAGQGNSQVPNTTHNSNYNKLKNTYITQIKSQKVNLTGGSAVNSSGA